LNTLQKNNRTLQSKLQDLS